MWIVIFLENLKNNASNRSRLYRAELHVKAVIEQSAKGLLNDESFSGIPRSPLWLKQKKKLVKRGSTNVKDKFLEWLDGQPPSISDGVTKNNKDSKWAIRVLDLYKADKGLSKSKPKSNASAAESVTRTKAKSVNVDGNTNKKVWKASEIQKMNPAMYEKYEKEIDLAFKEGRIDTRA